MDTVSGIIEVLKSAVEFIAGVFTGDWGRAWEGVKGIFTGVWNFLAYQLEMFINSMINTINDMFSMLNRFHISVPNWVPMIGGNSFGFNIPPIGHVNIPRLAQGAVIPPNREFMAVLGDQRHGTNLEAPESLIRQIVREEAGGISNEQIATIIELMREILARTGVYLDGRQIAETVTKHQRNMQRARGW